MTQFFLFALLLVAVVAALILPPLWRGRLPAVAGADRRAANLAILRDQLAELESEKAEGSLADPDFDQARRELQRRLLEEVEPEAGEAAPRAPSRKTAVALLLLLPTLSLLGYGLLGNLRALDPAQRSAPPQMTPEQVTAMVERLAARLQANPEDTQGWLMLGRSYKMLGRYDEAVAAYAHAEKAIDQDPDLLANYAEAIALANGKGLAGKPRQLVAKALKLDPQHAHSLFLAGAAALEAGDNQQGIAYWEALLPQVEPDSDIDKMLRSGIEKMKRGK